MKAILKRVSRYRSLLLLSFVLTLSAQTIRSAQATPAYSILHTFGTSNSGYNPFAAPVQGAHDFFMQQQLMAVRLIMAL